MINIPELLYFPQLLLRVCADGDLSENYVPIIIINIMKMTNTPRRSRSRKARLALHQPSYDSGLRYDTPGLRYADTDPVAAPVTDGAKVKMELATRSNENLIGFVQNHIAQMTGNVNFPTPSPSAVDLQASLDAVQVKLALVESLTTQLREARNQLDGARAVLETNMTTRGAYVQTASNGNSGVILSSGLEVKNPPAPTGQLPPPSDLQVHLNGVTGLMLLSWKPVPKAKNYAVQFSEAVTPRNWNALPNSDKSKLQIPNMDVGKTYAFRVAASGGSTGQSYWCPEVIRAAA